MLNFVNVSLRRGPRLLFEGASFSIHDGQKVGVTGANGTGKSSLLALVRGDLQPDGGDFTCPPGLTIAHVAQETPAVDAPAVRFVMQGDAELDTLLQELHAAEAAGDGARQAKLHARMEGVDGYTAHSRAARLLRGLGFAPGDEDTPVRSFSGGWRVRLNLARALMCRSDLLLLDEPTNHLDLDAVIWLEEWLRAYRGTLLLIAHDRDFLDQVVDHVAHIEGRRLELYRGDYSTFERRRAERMALQRAVYEKQQREIAHVRRFVDRFRAKASKARQVQSRLKALAAMESIAPAHVDSPFHFGFRAPEKLPNPLLHLRGARAGYGGRTVLEDVKLGLAPGDRIGLLGANGAGKSTLVKLLAGELAPLGGEREAAPDLRIGYFAQHQLEQLRGEQSPLAHLQRIDPGAREQDLRGYLGGFGFGGDTATEPVAPRSGGEKARLVLALIVYRRPNLLLLDEPTNHLDLEMRHVLTVALQEFEGAMVLVSHDRHLLRTSTDALLLVAGGMVQPFAGDLEEYARMLSRLREQDEVGGAAAASAAGDRPESAGDAASRKERRRRDAEHRRRLQPLRAEVERLERELARVQAERRALEERLADPAVYGDTASGTLQDLLRRRGQAERRVREIEDAWLEAHEALDSAQQKA